jgi:hypothetical protein
MVTWKVREIEREYMGRPAIEIKYRIIGRYKGTFNVPEHTRYINEILTDGEQIIRGTGTFKLEKEDKWGHDTEKRMTIAKVNKEVVDLKHELRAYNSPLLLIRKAAEKVGFAYRKD